MHSVFLLHLSLSSYFIYLFNPVLVHAWYVHVKDRNLHAYYLWKHFYSIILRISSHTYKDLPACISPTGVRWWNQIGSTVDVTAFITAFAVGRRQFPCKWQTYGKCLLICRPVEHFTPRNAYSQGRKAGMKIHRACKLFWDGVDTKFAVKTAPGRRLLWVSASVYILSRKINLC